MTIGSSEITSQSWLLCRVGTRICALPLEHVVETMRPLPVEPMADAPACVLGLCLVRGDPIPAIDLQALFGKPAATPQRMVTLNVAGRRIAAVVDSVVGVRAIDPDQFHGLPPLLHDAAGDIVSAVGALDSELLLFLRAARLAPQELLDRVGSTGAGS
jgi:purine-binding chemotaxis protein CheW